MGTLFAVHVLWHRESRRHKWRAVGRAHSGPAALVLMDASGFKNGDWILKDDGSDPNDKEPERGEGERE